MEELDPTNMSSSRVYLCSSTANALRTMVYGLASVRRENLRIDLHTSSLILRLVSSSITWDTGMQREALQPRARKVGATAYNFERVAR